MRITSLFFYTFIFLLASSCKVITLSENEAIRVYLEFDDGKNRGMYDPSTKSRGFKDEGYDATTTAVINWHSMPEGENQSTSRLKYRRVRPYKTNWKTARGVSFPFWSREEFINRIVLKNLTPNSIYEFRLSKNGKTFRLRTMPPNLNDRVVKIAVLSDLQTSNWTYPAIDNAELVAKLKPDMFVAVGDFLNSEGDPHDLNDSENWAKYLDILYGAENGYFHHEIEVEGNIYENIIIPHVAILGNHDVGGQLISPRDVNTTSTPKYPEFIGLNWLELLFHFPFSSEGFRSEINPDHPNVNKDNLVEGFNIGGFGSLSFGNYLLLIALNNIQFWEGKPDDKLRDWTGNHITEKWPWYGRIHSEVQQDIWLENTLKSNSYRHILPFYHRGLFGGTRLNMSHKNRDILKYWLPLFQEYNVKYITEAHDHLFVRTIPIGISKSYPSYAQLSKIPYKPLSWELVNVNEEYLDQYYTVNCIINNSEIIGWEFDNKYISYDSKGMIVNGCGGWAAGRRKTGDRQAGNAGWWFVDKEKGGEIIEGDKSFYTTLISLSQDEIIVESYHPSEIKSLEQHTEIVPFNKFKWNFDIEVWLKYTFEENKWIKY